MQAKLYGLFNIYLGNLVLFLEICSITGLKPWCEFYKISENGLNCFEAFLQII
jgi:hypothetical protein